MAGAVAGPGAVAACTAAAADAGAEALAAGGNAVDAAVAAMLTVYLSGPVMSSPAGGGVALVQLDPAAPPAVWDFFPRVPGLPARRLDPAGAQFVELTVDYGAGGTQAFHVGRAAAAPPTALRGLLALQAAHGDLPFAAVAHPLIARAEAGVPLDAVQARFLGLFEALLRFDPSLEAHFAPGGRLAGEGDRLPAPGYAAALAEAAETGRDPLTEGGLRARLLAEFGAPRGLMTPADLAACGPRRAAPLRVAYRDAEVWLPGSPSLGGTQVALMLLALGAGPPPPREGPARWTALAALAQAAEEERRREPSRGDPAWLTPARVARTRARAVALAAAAASPPAEPDPMPGNTTHVSAVDAAGRAVAVTTTFGETCGVAVPGLGLAMNNLLGEEDINPAGFLADPPGSPLPTRMTPTLVRLPGGATVALGTGGSDRITSVVLQGILRLVDEGRDLAGAVAAPRVHGTPAGRFVEGASLATPGAPAAPTRAPGGFRVFAGADLYFGGMHTARVGPGGGCEARGDPRRGGHARPAPPG